MVRRGKHRRRDRGVVDAGLRDRGSGAADRGDVALMNPLRYLFAIAAVLIATSASAVDLNCKGPSNVEQFKYSWRLRGGLSWVAGLVFPTSGVGEMKTRYPKPGEQAPINSQLLITSTDRRTGFYAYESDMDQAGQRTLMTYHAYAWKNKSRNERT